MIFVGVVAVVAECVVDDMMLNEAMLRGCAPEVCDVGMVKVC